MRAVFCLTGLNCLKAKSRVPKFLPVSSVRINEGLKIDVLLFSSCDLGSHRVLTVSSSVVSFEKYYLFWGCNLTRNKNPRLFQSKTFKELFLIC